MKQTACTMTGEMTALDLFRGGSNYQLMLRVAILWIKTRLKVAYVEQRRRARPTQLHERSSILAVDIDLWWAAEPSH